MASVTLTLFDETCDNGGFAAEIVGNNSRVIHDWVARPSVLLRRRLEAQGRERENPHKDEKKRLERTIGLKEVDAYTLSHAHPDHQDMWKSILRWTGHEKPFDNGNYCWGFARNGSFQWLPVPQLRHRPLPNNEPEQYKLHEGDFVVRYQSPHGSYDGGALKSAPMYGHIMRVDDVTFTFPGDKHGRFWPIDIAMLELHQPDVLVMDGLDMQRSKPWAQYDALQSLVVAFSVLKPEAEIYAGHHGFRYDKTGGDFLPLLHLVAEEAGFEGPIKRVADLQRAQGSKFRQRSFN